MAMIPGICDDCGAVFGSEALVGAKGSNISLGGAKIGPCPSCGGIGRVPEGTYDLIGDTLRVVKAAAFEKTELDAVIEILEKRAQGRLTDEEVLEQVEADAPTLTPTVKDYLAKSDPASWLALLIAVLTLIQSASTSSPEEVADAIWLHDRAGQICMATPGLSSPAIETEGLDKGSAKARGKTDGRQIRGPR